MLDAVWLLWRRGSPERPRSAVIKRARVLGIGALIGGAFYLLLVDTRSSPELYVLAAVGIASGVAFSLGRTQGFTEAAIRPRWLLSAWRPVLKVFSDIAILCQEALHQLVRPRPVRGCFRAVRFRASDDTPHDAGRRALTEWLGSLAPNTIVVGVDPDRGLLLVHQLRREGDPDQVDPLGLG
jgi:Na+/H+ ion antiporter subunit